MKKIKIIVRRGACLLLAGLLCTGMLGGCAGKEKTADSSITQPNDPSYTIGVPEGEAAAEQAG